MSEGSKAYELSHADDVTVHVDFGDNDGTYHVAAWLRRLWRRSFGS